MIDIQKMMKQAQEVQFKLQEMQERLKEIDVEGESGGGLVKVVMSCAGELRGLTIDPSIIVADDKETLEDLIVAAVNNASENKDERIRQETESMMREMGLPPGFQLPNT
ncbi:MAG: YbaB/EbfC family nucleoid-associated protein [Alphaproteobacteria bacterium]|nr:YbaB/EbfC family nucleoid-associated protein [Alphaproteobacteria bacterium]